MEARKKKYKCFYENCDAIYRKKSILENHLRKHNGERPFVCDIDNCQKTYTNAAHLKRHKCLSHEKGEELICKECNLVLNNKYAFKKHQNRKHNLREYPFYCNECSQGFMRKRQLQTHKYLHTGEPLFKCEPCKLSFVHESEYNKHKFYHKKYTCECGEEFHRWTLILKHKKETCTQKREFKCDICNKNFSTDFNLKQHKKIHEDIVEKSILCCPFEDCERVYVHKKNLNAHIQSFHEKIDDNVRLPCTVEGCTKTLKSKRNLQQHLKLIHFRPPKPPTVRRPRKDKGIPKKCMASVLSGVNIPSSEHKKIATNKIINVSETTLKESTNAGNCCDESIMLETKLTQQLSEKIVVSALKTNVGDFETANKKQMEELKPIEDSTYEINVSENNSCEHLVDNNVSQYD